jgi:hypothetical protein
MSYLVHMIGPRHATIISVLIIYGRGLLYTPPYTIDPHSPGQKCSIFRPRPTVSRPAWSLPIC